MPRPPRNQLSPWIEKLILSYSSREEEEGRGGRLKAHVVGVGEMSQSQAQNSDGLTGLLFLSDGFLQIPAVLTAAAWERLQEQEDRECLASLLNATACIHDYQLRFHMASEQTRCRFFLSVGELATTAAGPVRDNTPCCTTASSVRLKICETWRALLSEEAEPESQRSQCGFDLSELLGEWQHDCVQAVLDDVRDRLAAAAGGGSVSPQPSTSSDAPLLTLAATGWDVDRLRFKGAERFTVPVKYLLIPEDGARQPRTSSHTMDTRTHSSPEPAPLSVDDAARRIPAPAAAERLCGADEIPPLPVDDVTRHVIESDVTLLSNPWDIFPPPCTSSSSEASPDATTTNAEAKSRPGHAVTATGTRLPVHITKESQPTSAQSTDFSDFPPYLKPPHSTGPVSTPASLALPFVSPPEPAEVSPPAGKHKPSASDQETCEKETTHRKAKRKRSEAAAEAQTSVEPPSWLFDTQAGSEDGGSHRNGQSVSSMWRKTPSMHSSGRPFSYTYQMTGQNLQDFSGFTVSESLLHWAVKYLLPKQEPVTSDPGRGHVTVGSTG